MSREPFSHEESGKKKGHAIEAYGEKGMKSTPWRKTFKSVDHLNNWEEKHDAKTIGMRHLKAEHQQPHWKQE